MAPYQPARVHGLHSAPVRRRCDTSVASERNGNGHLVDNGSTRTLNHFSPKQVFVCPEESLFYSQCLEKLVVTKNHPHDSIIEFGAGDGTPVISCLMKNSFEGIIHGYELNPSAAGLANSKIAEYDLATQYQVHNSCFFEGAKKRVAGTLIANPPYIPAPDSDILMPALHGGEDGANLTRELLSLGFTSALLMISAYSNPIETVQHAQREGYLVADFLVTPLPFGYYSSEPKVKQWLAKMKTEGKAFYSHNIYFLAGVLFQKTNDGGVPDLSAELLKVLTSL